jgi:hypothetical protein
MPVQSRALRGAPAANISYPRGLLVSLRDRKPAAYEHVLSVDQTTRIHATLPASKDDKEPTLSWHEVGRPQVHGYDLVGVISLDPLRFVSVADEKVARVFAAPRGFVKTLRGLDVADLEVNEVKLPGQADDRFTQISAWNQENLPVSATVPPLGLSNKATSDGQHHRSNQISPRLSH